MDGRIFFSGLLNLQLLNFEVYRLDKTKEIPKVAIVPKNKNNEIAIAAYLNAIEFLKNLRITTLIINN